MKKHILPIVLWALLNCLNFVSTGQNASKDTSNYPFWIEMMQDRSINLYKTKSAFDTYWKNREVTKGSGYKPFMRWYYAMERIVDDSGNIPNYQESLDEYNLFLRRYANPIKKRGIGVGSATCYTQGDWKELGPYGLPTNQPSQPNGNGRINGLAFHPSDSNTIWAGAPQGGLWKTIDGGTSWTSSTDTLPTLGVSDIAIDNSNPNIIYLGTGDRDGGDASGMGVYKSINNGTTWSASNSGMGNRTVSKIEIDPNRDSTLVAAVNGGIYRSINSGGSWTQTSAGNNWKDLVFKPNNSDTIYATYSYRFYRSINNGVSWTQITSGLPSAGNRGAIAVCASAPEIVYFIVTDSRVFRGLYVSYDGGTTFRTMSTTPNIMDYSHLGTGTSGQAWYDLDIAVDPKRPQDVYVGGVNIFKSQDTGKTWNINAHWVGNGGVAAVHADNHVLEFSPHNNAMYIGNDGGVYKATGNGANYTEITADIRISQIYRLAQSASNEDWIINGYQDNGTGMMRGMKNWYTVMGGDGMDCQIDPSTTKYAYSDLYYGDVRRYTDGVYSGKIAANGTNGINEQGAWVTSFILQEGTPSTMFIGYDNVWRSTNIQNATANTVTWTKISSFSSSADIHYLENSISDPAVLYVSKKDGYMYKSTNVNAATPTWTQCTRPTATYPRWIETDPTNSNIVYIAQSNNIYKSTNGGSTWTDISGNLPNSTINCIVFDSSAGMESLYIGMNIGIYYKDTTMTNWALFNKNVPLNSEVTDLDIYYNSINPECSKITASTYGRGNWRSNLYPVNARKPKPQFYSSDTSLNIWCNTNSIQLFNESCDFPTRFLWKIEPSATFINGTDSCSENPYVEFNTAGDYSVTLYAENCNGMDSIVETNFIHVYDTIQAATCTNGTLNALSNLGIFNLSLNGYSRASSGSGTEGTYVDLACTDIIRLEASTAYTMTVTVGSSYNEGVKVFIDYNNDGDFIDAGENVATSNPASGIHSFSFTTPALPNFNEVLRMRVLSNYNTLPANSCSSLNYGQSENYGIYFELNDPKIRTNKDTICPGEVVQIIDSSATTSSSYLWNFGINAIPTSATGKGPHNVVFGTSGFHHVSLTAGGNTILDSNLVYVKTLNPTIPKAFTTYQSNSVYTDTAGWSHYCDCDSNVILLSIKMDTSGAVVSKDSVWIDNDNPRTWTFNKDTGIITNTWGGVILNRLWEVKPSTQPTVDIGVRYYFTKEDYDSIYSAYTRASTNYGFPHYLNSVSDLECYKITSSSYRSFIRPDSVNRYDAILLDNGTVASNNEWVLKAYTGGQYAEFKVSSFSGGGIGVGSGGIPLPIELLDFSGSLQADNTVVLNWSTVNETNNSHFEIERSKDGFEFSKIEQVKSLAIDGYSNALLAYQYIDLGVKTNEVLYYRLKQVDNGGEALFSKIIRIQIDNGTEFYPNPNDGILYLSNKMGDDQISIYTSENKLVAEVSIESSSNSIDISFLPRGIYYLKVNSNNRVKVFKLFKK